MDYRGLYALSSSGRKNESQVKEPPLKNLFTIFRKGFLCISTRPMLHSRRDDLYLYTTMIVIS